MDASELSFSASNLCSFFKLLHSNLLLLSTVESSQLAPPFCIGVMITASHNPPHHNGIKLLLPDGHLLPPHVIKALNKCIAKPSETDPLCFIEALPAKFQPAMPTSASPPSPHKGILLLLGSDTRLSSPGLLDIFLSPNLDSVPKVNFGYISTPTFSTAVRDYSLSLLSALLPPPSPTSLVSSSSSSYARHYESLLALLSPSSPAPALHVDCAMGAGALALADLIPLIPAATIVPFNVPTLSSVPARSLLNTFCGSDYVLGSLSAPEVHEGPSPPRGSMAASFDGDGDRIIFHVNPIVGSLEVLTGDHISALLASFLKPLLSELNPELTLGVVQTLYSNTAVANFLRGSLGVDPDTAATGVVNLHHAAEKYDLGVYYEANGHGTVLFSPRARDEAKRSTTRAGRVLAAVLGLSHQMVGDAVPAALLVPLVLAHLKLPPSAWARWWTDLPTYQSMVAVVDKSLIFTNANESKVVSPSAMQADIDRARGACRCFVRASGTEDIVRVFVEGEGGERVRGEVEGIVRSYCGARSKL